LGLSNSVALNASPALTVATGATLDASGRSDQTLTLVSGQTLNGSGTINGDLVSSSGSVITPSGSPGTLTFNNNLTLGNGSVAVLKLNKTSGTNDLLQVNGTITYAGTLAATNISASSLSANDQFKLFNATAYGGKFVSIIPPMPGSGLAWDASLLFTSGTLRVVVAPPPSLRASVSGSNLVLSVTNGIPMANCYALTATNLNIPLSNWTRLATNSFDLTGNVAFTNPVVRTTPTRFYRAQLP
jgi:uncharacterized protein with beta-barrel porin domain